LQTPQDLSPDSRRCAPVTNRPDSGEGDVGVRRLGMIIGIRRVAASGYFATSPRDEKGLVTHGGQGRDVFELFQPARSG